MEIQKGFNYLKWANVDDVWYISGLIGVAVVCTCICLQLQLILVIWILGILLHPPLWVQLYLRQLVITLVRKQDPKIQHQFLILVQSTVGGLRFSDALLHIPGRKVYIIQCCMVYNLHSNSLLHRTIPKRVLVYLSVCVTHKTLNV